jgi:hypothetical protein
VRIALISTAMNWQKRVVTGLSDYLSLDAPNGKGALSCPDANQLDVGNPSRYLAVHID